MLCPHCGKRIIWDDVCPVWRVASIKKWQLLFSPKWRGFGTGYWPCSLNNMQFAVLHYWTFGPFEVRKFLEVKGGTSDMQKADKEKSLP